MTTPNPFAINEKPSTQFGNLFLNFEEKQGSNGSYYQFNVAIGPLGGGDLIERKYFNFAQTPNDTKIFLDSLNNVTANQPMKLVNDDGSWIEYQWETFRDYGKKTVQYYQDNNADKLQADDKGRFFVEKGAIKLLRMFRDENECITEHDKAKGIENSNNPFATSSQTAVSAPTAAPAPVADKETASKFLPWIVKTAMNGGNRVDRDVLATMIAANDALRQHFTVDSPEVVAEIAKLETEPVF
jgi:hypothetical protein